MRTHAAYALSALLFAAAACSGGGTAPLTQAGSSGASTGTAAVPPPGSLYADIYEPQSSTYLVDGYAAEALGNAKPFAEICCHSGGGAIAVDPVSRIYLATDAIPASIDIFTSICPPLTNVGSLAIPDAAALIDGVATGSNGEIVVGTSTDFTTEPSIQHTYVFAPGSVGKATPSRDLSIPHWINATIDSNGYLYILAMTSSYQADQILVYAPNADGAATPVRTITRPSPDLTDIKVDSLGRIYTAGFTGGLAFAADATGAATPIAQTPVLEGKAYDSVAVDQAGTVYFGVTPANGEPATAVIEEYRFANDAFTFLGTLDSGVPDAEAHHLVIGP